MLEHDLRSELFRSILKNDDEDLSRLSFIKSLILKDSKIFYETVKFGEGDISIFSLEKKSNKKMKVVIMAQIYFWNRNKAIKIGRILNVYITLSIASSDFDKIIPYISINDVYTYQSKEKLMSLKKRDLGVHETKKWFTRIMKKGKIEDISVNIFDNKFIPAWKYPSFENLNHFFAEVLNRMK